MLRILGTLEVTIRRKTYDCSTDHRPSKIQRRPTTVSVLSGSVLISQPEGPWLGLGLETPTTPFPD